MIRHGLQQTGLGAEHDFRWRGGEVSRIEGFSDAVFAFALTLLVVSLEVPKSYSELMHVMRGFLGFAICFAILLMVWYEHYLYFRRYGLQDMFSLVMNAFLLFLVLFYVYPLKFLFSLVAFGMWSLAGLGGQDMEAPALHGNSETAGLFLIYSAGYIAVFLVFALQYLHVLRRSEELELTESELLHTREKLYSFYGNIGIGILSAGFALAPFRGGTSLAGFVYFLIGPMRAYLGARFGRLRRLAGERAAKSVSAEQGPGGAALIVFVALLAAGGTPGPVLAAVRDTAVYPVSGRSAPTVPAAPLLFEKIFEQVLPGLPATDPLAPAPDGKGVIVRTASGTWEVIPTDPGHAPQEGDAVPVDVEAASRLPGSTGCSWPGKKTPSWIAKVTNLERPPACVDGPAGVVALLSPDGSIFGRERNNGHLLWRRTASNRVSTAGASWSDYLLVAADSARSLEAFRWADGTTAGSFRLESENAYMASGPVLVGRRICILSIRSPRAETRVICVKAREQAPPAPASP